MPAMQHTCKMKFIPILGMLAMIYNPLTEPMERRIRLSLYYAGLTNRALIHWEDGREETIALARDYSLEVKAGLPARSRLRLKVRAADAD
jgi:hypothetical protein